MEKKERNPFPAGLGSALANEGISTELLSTVSS